MTIVAGRVVAEDGRVVSVDETALLAEARELHAARRPALERTWASADAERPATTPSCAAPPDRRRHEQVDRMTHDDTLPAAAAPGHELWPYRPITAPSGPTWPDGRRLAVYVAVGLEEYRFGVGRTEDVVPDVTVPDLVNTSWRDYGNRVGAFRLLDRLDRAGIRRPCC